MSRVSVLRYGVLAGAVALAAVGAKAQGLINKQVARLLGLRLNTVRNHSQNILYKLRAHSRLEAVATAVRDGIIGYRVETVAD